MIRKIVLITWLCVQSLSLLADDNRAELEVFYRLTYETDTVRHRAVDAVVVLRTNQRKSLFYGQACFEKDSLTDNARGPQDYDAINDSIRSKYGRVTMRDYVLKDFAAHSLDFYGTVMGVCKYTEPIPEFSWKLLEETKKIGGHECQKAECHYMGRTYVAWFAPDIPISDGPWKFCGLPGLVLEVSDLSNQYVFTFLGMSPCRGEIAVPVMDAVKTTKAKYLKMKQLSIDDPNAFLEGVAATLGIRSDKVPKRHFYSTMERVWALDEK